MCLHALGVGVQVIDIPVAAPGVKEIRFDEEWLAILRETHGIMNLSRGPTRFPTAFATPPAAAAEHRAAVAEALTAAGGAVVPRDGFARTVDPGKRGQGDMPTSIPRNPQTEAVLRLIDRPWNLGGETQGPGAGLAAPLTGDDLLGVQAGIAEDGVAGDMFKPVDIHNMDPHAISDAKIGEDGANVGVWSAAGVSRSGEGVLLSNPEEIYIGSSDDG